MQYTDPWNTWYIVQGKQTDIRAKYDSKFHNAETYVAYMI